ncbi:MAG TPA: ATP-binding protein, partial [Longimicrobium sp.]|nr:ATP-binding protein [Longimicrobium sp.]
LRARVFEGYREVPLEMPIPATDVVRSGEPQWIEGKDALLARYPHLASAQAASGNQAWATLPLPGPKGPIGSFALTFREARHVREAEKSFLRALAQQASMALERARLYDEATRTEVLTRAAVERLRLLSEGSRAFSAAPLEEAPLLDAICREVSRQFSEAAGVSLLSADGRFVVPRATYHPDPEVATLILRSMQQRPVPYGEGNLGRVVATGQPLLVSRVDPPVLVASMPAEYREFLERSPVRSFMVVPLRVHGRIAGTLQASRHAEGSEPFGPEDLALLGELADRAGLALGQARLYEEARAAARVREDFLTVAAHELRTPLTSLKLQLAMVRRTAGADALERARVPLDRVNGQVDRLAQLVESLLDVGRIAQGRLEVELGPVDVGALVRDVLGRMEPVLAQAGCTPRVQVPDDGAWARADTARLDQVLVNLLSNAAKYGAGKPVDVQVWRAEGRVSVRVRDEGIGIAPESLPRLFERFGRAVSGRHYAGLGLGLYITRQLVEAMGGQVRVDSRLGEGSTFTVTLEAVPKDGEGAAGNGA